MSRTAELRSAGQGGCPYVNIAHARGIWRLGSS